MAKTTEGLWRLNPSGLYSFTECKTCFWLDQHIGRYPSLPLLLNDAVDRKLKARYDHCRELGELPAEVSDKLIGYSLFSDQEQLDSWRNWRQGLRCQNTNDGYVLSGALDEILINEKGEYVPADYKSSGNPPKEDKYKYYILQLHAYALMLYAKKLPVAKEAFLLHYFPENKDSRSLKMDLICHVDRVELNLRQFCETLRAMVDLLNGECPTKNGDCNKCKYRHSLNALNQPSVAVPPTYESQTV